MDPLPQDKTYSQQQQSQQQQQQQLQQQQSQQQQQQSNQTQKFPPNKLPSQENPQQELQSNLTQNQDQAPDSQVKDDWEININLLEAEVKLNQGAFGTLYKGSYCGQEVAIKVIKDVQNDQNQLREFLQEVSIMKKIRHKNIVQFIGACTRPPYLCIVVEYMSGGSVYDHIRKEGLLKIHQVIEIALSVARGMDYLHLNQIVHRDLKAANLLLNEYQVVKIADFGVARVLSTQGIMTSETGTYRWMAPEIIEHKAYNEKADIFSFGILLWELITGKVPYSEMSPLQAAIGVVQQDLRPTIPQHCPAELSNLMQCCWQRETQFRPNFKQITQQLQIMHSYFKDEEEKRKKTIFSRLKRQPQ